MYPRGSVSLIGISDTDEDEDELTESLINLSSSFLRENTYARWSFIKSNHFQDAVLHSLQTLKGSFFSPNILFLRMLHDETHDEEIYNIISTARMNKMGVQLYIEDTVAQLGRTASINVWMREKGPDWDLDMDLGNVDLALLMAYKLKVNWNAIWRVITVVEEDEVENAYNYIENMLEVARLKDAHPHVEIGSFQEALNNTPRADIDIFGLPEDPDLKTLRSYVELTKSACVFVADSGKENILA